MLDKLISKIEWYEKENIDEKLKDLEEKQSVEISKLQSYNNKKQELSEVTKTSDLVRNQDNLRRNIEDNLRYREVKAKVDGCTLEIESLEERILAMGGISASEADLRKLSKERERLLSELNKCHGTVAVYQKAISKNKVDLKNPAYKEIDLISYSSSRRLRWQTRI